LKKIFTFIFVFGLLLTPNHSQASNIATEFDGYFHKNTLYEAELVELIDGDTARFDVFGREYKVRFLFIDTPENTKEKEAYGQEATDYAKKLLQSGTIYLEIDNGNVFDKYDRLLAWVWVDDALFQTEMAKAGLVEDFYDYGDYKYEDEVRAAMDDAKEQKLGIYSDGTSTDGESNFIEDNWIYLAFIILAAVLSFLKKRKK